MKTLLRLCILLGFLVGMPRLAHSQTQVTAQPAVEHVICDSGCGSPPATPDTATFTAGVTNVSIVAAAFDDTLTALAAGKSGAPRMTAYRGIHFNLRDNSGNEVLFPAVLGTGGGFKVSCVDGCGGAASFADNSAFTFGTTSINITGYVFDDVAPNAATENRAAAPRMSGNRVPYSILRDAEGNERGANVNSDNQLSVSVDNVPAMNLAFIAGASVATVGPGMQEIAISDGTSFFKSAIDGLNSTGPGLQATQLIAQFDNVAPTAITENQFGNVRMSANRNLFFTVRDAAGNERGANVNASNQLSVSVDNTPAVTCAACATSTNQTGGGQKTQLVDAGGNVVGATTNALDINTKSWLGSTAPTIGQKTAANSLPVVWASDTVLPAGPSERTASGTLGALNATVSIDGQGYKTVGVNFTGNLDGTVEFQGSVDNVNWRDVLTLAYSPTADLTVQNGTVFTGSSTGQYLYLTAAPYRYLRVIASVYNSGSSTASLYAQSADRPFMGLTHWLGSLAPTVGQKTMASSLPVTLASNQSTLSVNTAQIAGSTTSTVSAGVQKVGIADSTGAAFLSAANALNSTGSGVQAAQLVGQFDDVSPTSITENQFGNVRFSANRNLYFTLRDAAGNERGQNVTSNNNGQVELFTGATAYDARLGTKTNNNAAPGATNLGVLPMLTTAADQSWTEGNLVAGSVDLSGFLRTKVSSWLGSTAPTVGSKTSANSIPVVVASDQGAVPVSGAVTANPTTTNHLSIAVAESVAAPTALTWYLKRQWALPASAHFIPSRAFSAVTTAGSRTLIGVINNLGNLNVSTNTFTDGNSVASPRHYARLIGCVTTVMSATANTVTVTYVDELGNSQTTAAVSIPASTPVGNCFDFPLNATTGQMLDVGVRDITAMADTAAPTGVLTIYGMNPILDALGVGNAYEQSDYDQGELSSAEQIAILFQQGVVTAQQRNAGVLGSIR